MNRNSDLTFILNVVLIRFDVINRSFGSENVFFTGANWCENAPNDLFEKTQK